MAMLLMRGAAAAAAAAAAGGGPRRLTGPHHPGRCSRQRRTVHPRRACPAPPGRRPSVLCRADPVEAVPSAQFPPIDAPEALEEEQRWVAGIVTMWLDEEWTPLDVHQRLGAAAGGAYRKLRANGERDVATVLLGLSSELMAFNFRETFTDPFEVANKVVEMLMMRHGTDVCCTSDDDCDRLARFEQQQQQQQRQ